MSKSSALENKFKLYWRAIQGQELKEEHRFYEGRRWRFDFAHVQSKTAVEVEGGVWSGGRHTRGSGYSADCEKYNQATHSGWAVFRLTGAMITAPELIKIMQYISQRTQTN